MTVEQRKGRSGPQSKRSRSGSSNNGSFLTVPPDMLLGHSNVREQKDTPAEGPWGHAAPSSTFPDSQIQHGTSEETVFCLSA